MKDKLSEERLQLLHPKVRMIFKSFIEECESTFNIILRISQGMRTFAEEDVLYAQGRTTPGKIVTNTKGGESYHNYGLAIDLVEMNSDDKEVNWKYDMSILLPIAKKHGEEWGGEWVHIKDYPHFQITFGYKWKDLLIKYNKRDLLPGTKFVNI